MKRIIQTFAISIFVVGLYIGCSKSADSPAPSTPTTPTTPSAPAPTANFTYAGEGLAPSTVTFTNTSSNSTSYSWDFGDNTTSTATNPTHTYRVGGVFTVKLTATGAGGTNSTTKTVNIIAPTKYTITKVTIDSIPFTNANRESWDPFGAGPDVYFKITNINAVSLWSMATTSSVKIKDQKNLPLSFSLASPYQTSDLKNSIGIVVYDSDLYDLIPNEDDIIGSVAFSIPIYTLGSNSFPTSISESYKGTKITINLTWQ